MKPVFLEYPMGEGLIMINVLEISSVKQIYIDYEGDPKFRGALVTMTNGKELTICERYSEIKDQIQKAYES